MALGINVRQTQAVSVLDMTGRLTYKEECDALRECVKQLLATGKKNILLNLKKVSDSDSTGLGCLATALTSVRNQGGELRLLHATERIQRVLESTRLITVLDVYDNEQEAIASFK